MDVLLNWQDSHRLNIRLLSVVGFWPYGNKFGLRLKRFLASFFVVLSCFSQFATFFTVNYTRRMLLRNVPYMLLACNALVKHIAFLVAGNCIKRIVEDINCDWKALSSKEEIGIMKKYVERGKFHTKALAMLLCPFALCLVLQPLSSVVLEIVMPLNETRSVALPCMVEFFFDQKQHLLLVALLFDGIIIVSAFGLVSTEAFLIVCTQHACALFEVTSCRIEKLLCASGMRDLSHYNTLVMIGNVVNIHCRAIRYCKVLREDLLPSYLILLVLNILSLSAYIFRATDAFASHEYTECLISVMFCFAILGYMFYLNFILQHVQDSSGNIFNNWYETAWYNAPITTQKLILFCMVNCIKPVTTDLCSLFAPGYAGFSLIARMSMSYATALLSFQ